MVETARRTANGLDLMDLGERIRLERLRRRLSLDALAERAQVSRSMLSAVERGAKVPTVIVLHRIATGLGTTVSRLLGEEAAARVVLLRHGEQDVARDPSGWERRVLSPVLPGVEFELMRTTIPVGLDVGASPPHPPGTREYVAVERGILLLTVAGVAYRLVAGDSIYYAGDCIHAFANPGDEPCVYYLAVAISANGPSPRLHAGSETANGPEGEVP